MELKRFASMLTGGRAALLERLNPDGRAARWLAAWTPPGPPPGDRPDAAWDLPRWQETLRAERSLPRRPEVAVVTALLDEAPLPVVLHLAAVAAPDRAIAVLAALDTVDPVERRTRLMLALCGAPAPMVEPLVAAVGALSIGHLLWPDARHPPLDGCIERVDRALPIDPGFAEVLAGAAETERRWNALRHHVAARLDRLSEVLDVALAEIERMGAPTTAAVLQARWRKASTRALMWQFGGPAVDGGPSAPRRDLAAARDWLLERPGWPDAVDRQRWGVGAIAGDLTGDWFPHGLIERALWRMAPEGGRRQGSIAALVEALPRSGPRYYREWPHIPVDADCLGLAIDLAARVRDRAAERVEGWLAGLGPHIADDGRCPTWLYSGDPAERLLPWPGDDCLASRLSLVEGLAAWDRARFAAVIAAQLDEAFARVEGPWVGGGHYYPPVWATAQLLRLAPAGDRRVDGLVAAWRGRQGPDGGFGSPVTTALIGAALADRGALSGSALRRAARFLGEHQFGDGRWSAEPIYFTPGKPGVMRPLQSDSLSTALCGAALAAFVEAS